MEFLLVGLAVIAAFLLLRGGFGRLPGDVRLDRPGFAVRAPLASSCLVSIVLSVVLSVALSVCAGGLVR